MEISEYKNIHKHEGSHFFYVTTHKLVLSFARKYLNPASGENLKVLDAGCGTGLLAKKLMRLGTVWGIDVHPQALKLSKARGVKVKRASVEKILFADSSFDLLTSIDVVYHKKVKNDQKALSEFYRVLKPGGLAIIRTPAHMWLYTSHDMHIHTKRRYEKEELELKLKNAGFIIERLSFVNLLLLPFSFLLRLFEKLVPPKRGASAIRKTPKIINNLLTKALLFENQVLLRFNLPGGIGLVAICRKGQTQN